MADPVSASTSFFPGQASWNSAYPLSVSPASCFHVLSPSVCQNSGNCSKLALGPGSSLLAAVCSASSRPAAPQLCLHSRPFLPASLSLLLQAPTVCTRKGFGSLPLTLALEFSSHWHLARSGSGPLTIHLPFAQALSLRQPGDREVHLPHPLW